MFKVETNNDGVIWITHPESFNSTTHRVASIEYSDKNNVWFINISKGTFSLWLSLSISPENTKEKIITLTKDLMMFAQCGIEFQ